MRLGGILLRLSVIAASSVIAWIAGCDNTGRETEKPLAPSRIISLAPSITETIFALGLSEKLVGVTSYCTYPKEARLITRVGGYADANLEKMIALKPDMVILEREHQKQRTFLRRFGIAPLTVNYDNIANICSSFALIGRACGATGRADSLIAVFDEKINARTTKTNGPRQKILLCVGRDSPGGGTLKGVFVAGAGTYYNDLIRAAGAINAFPESLPRFPRLSQEGLISLAPDIIIDVAPAMEGYECSALVADWRSLPRIPAVHNGRVHCIAEGYATVPGPRGTLLLDDLRMIVEEGER